MSGFQFQNPAGEEKAAAGSIWSSPAAKIALNVVLFTAGVVFIQSPLMDMLVPQLE